MPDKPEVGAEERRKGMIQSYHVGTWLGTLAGGNKLRMRLELE